MFNLIRGIMSPFKTTYPPSEIESRKVNFGEVTYKNIPPRPKINLSSPSNNNLSKNV